MYHAKNGTVQIGKDTMEYVSFGNGTKILLLIPGLGDGLRTVKGMAHPLAYMYRQLAKEYTVYLCSRRNHLPEMYSSWEMARDIQLVMDTLGIEKAHIVGVSQGGTIAQYLALEYPEKVDRLVLVATYARTNKTIQEVLRTWIGYAQKRDYRALFVDTAEKTYSEGYLKKNRKLYWLMTKIGVPQSFNRFITQANACLTHDTFDCLPQIQCPTLILGGKQDKIVTSQASVDMAERIPHSTLYLYDDWGHGLYEEAPDFWDRIMNFLEK